MSGNRVRVTELPLCDVCHHLCKSEPDTAYADCYIPPLNTWGNVCRRHFVIAGCRLGTGQGQVLELVKVQPLTTCQGCGHVAARPINTPHNCFINEEGVREEGGTYQ